LSGAHLELTPLEGLYILASVPLDNSGNLSYNGGTPYVAGKDGATAGEIFQHTMARVAYTFDSIGTARLTFAGGTGRGLRPLDKDKGTYEDLLSAPTLANTDASVLDLGFTFSGVENLAVDLGVEIPLPALSWSTISDPNPNNTPQNITEGSDVSSQVPYAVNLRANFTSGAFSIAGGVSGKFAGKFTTTPAGGDESAYEQGIIVGATLNPAFDAGIAVVGLVGELNFNGEDKKSVGSTTTTYDSTVNYNVIPYVQKTIGGASVYAGVQIGSTNQAKDPVDGKVSWDSYITWSIPLGFTYSF
ncbi:MAG: hypothetical protein LBQ30_08210, partial [Treponema sp.]|nr:hypothetical protein [Treponema sp.]